MNEIVDPVASARRRSGARSAPVDFEPGSASQEGTTASVRLHFTLLCRLDAGAVIAGGWLEDPEGLIAGITIGGEAGDRIDLFGEAVRLDDRAAREALGVPRDAVPRFIFLLPIAGSAAAWAEGLKLVLRFAAGRLYPAFAAALGAPGDLDTVVRAMPAEAGLGFAERLLAACGDGRSPPVAMPPRLDSFFEGIHSQIDPARNYGSGSSVWPAEGAVDQALRVDRAGILLKGWFFHGTGDAMREVAAVSLLGRRIILPPTFPRLPRPDLPAHDGAAGFVLFVPVPELAPADRFWFLEIGLESGMVRRLRFVCPPSPPAMTGIETAFGYIEPVAKHMSTLDALFRDALAPAVDALWARTRRDRMPAERFDYGEVAAAPQMSIVVPLYGRVDFVRHQIARFSNDPEFRSPSAIELIFVLDDPTRREPFEQLCRDVHAIYGVAFRTLVLPQNLGFSGANNRGAEAATGSLLLFLNSDILPKRPRWAGRLLQLYRSLDRCGILGCRLLLEDGSIQHAGMSFSRSLQPPRCWQNEHPGKGLPVAFDRSSGAARVPAVTGACLAIEPGLFAQLGGWPEDYVVGDFEDSDLCLRAYQAGWNVYYTPDIELYHLERQSVKLSGEADWRRTRTLYNEWKHTRNWGDFIPTLLAELENAS